MKNALKMCKFILHVLVYIIVYISLMVLSHSLSSLQQNLPDAQSFMRIAHCEEAAKFVMWYYNFGFECVREVESRESTAVKCRA